MGWGGGPAMTGEHVAVGTETRVITGTPWCCSPKGHQEQSAGGEGLLKKKKNQRHLVKVVMQTSSGTGAPEVGFRSGEETLGSTLNGFSLSKKELLAATQGRGISGWTEREHPGKEGSG